MSPERVDRTRERLDDAIRKMNQSNTLKSPNVAIVFLNHNGRRCLGPFLDRSIESALNQSYANTEVLFVDNGSSDDSIEYMRSKYGHEVRLIALGKNYGFCLGNNLASRYVSSDVEYLLFVNNDVILTESYTAKLVHFMEDHRWIGIAHGLQKMLSGCYCLLGGYIDSLGRAVCIEVTDLDEYIVNSHNSFVVAWASGSALIIRRRLFDKLKGFSPELFGFHDEIDLCARAIFLGYRVACFPQAIYYHKAGSYSYHNGGTISTPSRINWFSWYLANRNKWLTTLRYLPLREVVMSFLLGFPIEVLTNTFKSLRSRERPRARLVLRMVKYLIENVRRELMIRRKWSSRHHLMKNHIIALQNPLVQKHLRELAIKKALSLSRRLHDPALLEC